MGGLLEIPQIEFPVTLEKPQKQILIEIVIYCNLYIKSLHWSSERNKRFRTQVSNITLTKCQSNNMTLTFKINLLLRTQL